METPRPRPRRVVSRRRYRVRVAAVASVVDSRARALGGERRAERKTLGRALHRGVVERAGRSFHRGRVQGSLRDGVHVLRVPGVRRRGRGALGSAAPTDDALLTFGMFAVGLGSGVQLCVQPVAALFPECASTVMSALSGAFQVSGLVFLALTAGRARDCVYVFSGAAVVLFCLCYVMLPRGQSFWRRPTRTRRRRRGVERRARQRYSREEQLRSAEYFGLVAWFTVVVCPMQFYISAIGYALETKGDTTGEYSSIFSAAHGAARLRRWADASRIKSGRARVRAWPRPRSRSRSPSCAFPRAQVWACRCSG